MTAVVPAYNEAPRIGRVLDVLTTYGGFDEVIVVDDGSTDGTREAALDYAVRCLRNPRNQGKGRAMDLGVSHARGDVIFFADADVNGLTHAIIDEIARPVLRGDVEMFIGMRNRAFYRLNRGLVFVPLLGGERALTRRLWQSLPAWYKHRFRVETGLNHHARCHGNGFRYRVFQDLSQVVKERKYGITRGCWRRFGMYSDILWARLKLAGRRRPPSGLKSSRAPSHPRTAPVRLASPPPWGRNASPDARSAES